MHRPRGILFASCLCVASTGALAASPNVQFSAQTVQSSPDKTTRNAQIYVGDNQGRLDYQQDGQQMEPIEEVTIDVDDDYAGAVIEKITGPRESSLMAAAISGSSGAVTSMPRT